MPMQAIPTPEMFNTPGFSNVVRAGDLLVVSGQVSRDVDAQLVGRGDPHVQTRQVFDNLRTALAAAEADFEDVVKLTVYATNLSVRAAVHQVREELFTEPRPASTFLVVAGLADPDFLIETEALAYKPV